MQQALRGRRTMEWPMFVVCGEALMDVFAAGETPTGLALDARVGGSPFNVAVGLARLAKPVAFLGTVSRDFAGERLLQALRKEGVDVSCTPRSDAHTTLGLVGVDAHGVPSYVFYGEGGADRTLEPAALDALPCAACAIHLGSYAMTVEPVATSLRTLVEREHRRRLIAYDPNVRLKVEPALERWRDALAFMLPRTHLLKISAEDVSLLFPGTAPETLAAQWLAQGVALVVVTRGRDGAQAWSAQAQVSVPAQASAVIDTVGAGDSFQAALLGWLAEHDALRPSALQALAPDDVHAALRFASHAAAITCSRRGADLPRREEIEALLPA